MGILSGLTAVIGWCMIVWQTLASAGMNVITWDYVTYASTRAVYLGALFDILLSILLVTSIFALVLDRAKKTLYQAVSETINAVKICAYFLILEWLKKLSIQNMLTAGYGESRHAAILFTDMRGFTKASALSPPVI